MDFRRNRQVHSPHIMNGEWVESVSTFRFLGTADFTRTHNTNSLVKKAQQQLLFLPVQKENNLDQKLLLDFYHSSVESVHSYCLGV